MATEPDADDKGGPSDNDADDKPMKSMKLGGGGRFAKLKGQLAQKKGVSNPGALAAYIGREKYGSKKMASMADKGRK